MISNLNSSDSVRVNLKKSGFYRFALRVRFDSLFFCNLNHNFEKRGALKSAGPVANATSATWLIRHCTQAQYCYVLTYVYYVLTYVKNLFFYRTLVQIHVEHWGDDLAKFTIFGYWGG